MSLANGLLQNPLQRLTSWISKSEIAQAASYESDRRRRQEQWEKKEKVVKTSPTPIKQSNLPKPITPEQTQTITESDDDIFKAEIVDSKEKTFSERAKEFALHLARNRGCEEIFYGENQSGGSIVVFIETPIDCYELIDGGHMPHFQFGISVKKLRSIPADVDLESMNVDKIAV